MITRIERDIYFLAGIYFNDTYLINAYDITLSMLIETNDSVEQAIALERIEFFIKNIVANSVFINEEHIEVIENFEQTGMNVITLTTEPHDQTVAMVLMLKLNSILENKFNITDLTVSSLLSDGTRYPIVSEMAENNILLMGDHWWNCGDTNVNDHQVPGTNVVKLFNDDWDQFNLSWKKTNNKLT